MCQWLDSNPNIISWTSESIAIPYYNPIKQREARYFPDFLIKVRDKNKGLEKIWLIEVKPFKETIQPSNKGKKSKKTKLYEQSTFAVNKAKWIAANKFCKMKGWQFKLITEKELF